MTSPYPTYSTARIDTLVCPVLVDAGALRSCLPQAAQLSLPLLPHVPKGKHPIIVEVWRVHDGLIDFGGVSAHQWMELAGTAAGLGFGGSAGAALGVGIGGAAGAANGGALGMWLGPVGWWWGAATGAAVGAALGAAKTATAGARQAAHLAAAIGRQTSETTSRVIGTYNEIIVTTPCRRVQPGSTQRDFAFVLATYTDSAASILGERLIGWGYRKSPAFGMRTKDGVLELRTGSSRVDFKIASRAESSLSGPRFAIQAAAPVITSLSHPLLGVLSADRLVVSYLERTFRDSEAQVTPAAIHLEACAGFIPGLRSLTKDVKGCGANNPWGAFSVTGLPVTLSYPRSGDHQETGVPRPG